MRANLIAAALLGLALWLPAPASAAKPVDYLSVQQLAELTGLTEQEVRLMVGPYSTNPLYRTSFIRISREWQRALVQHGLLTTEGRDESGRRTVHVSRAGSSLAG